MALQCLCRNCVARVTVVECDYDPFSFIIIAALAERIDSDRLPAVVLQKMQLGPKGTVIDDMRSAPTGGQPVQVLLSNCVIGENWYASY